MPEIISKSKKKKSTKCTFQEKTEKKKNHCHIYSKETKYCI